MAKEASGVPMSMLMGFELQSLDSRESMDLHGRNVRISSSSEASG